MSLLDNLRNKAGKDSDHDEVNEDTASREKRNWFVMKPKMVQLLRYFHEFTELLNQIEQDKLFNFQLSKNVILKGFKKSDFNFVAPKDDGSEGCTFRYDLIQAQDIKIMIRNQSDANAVQESLQNKGIQFISKRDDNNHVYFKISPKITTRFVFTPDLNTGLISLYINNYDGGWNQTIQFKPGKVTEDFLDELGKYIIGEENTFMDITGNRLSDKTRKKLKAKIKADETGKQQMLKEFDKKEKAKQKFNLFGLFKR